MATTICQVCQNPTSSENTTDIGPIGDILPACDPCYETHPEVQALAAFYATPSYVEQQARNFVEECSRLGIEPLPD